MTTNIRNLDDSRRKDMLQLIRVALPSNEPDAPADLSRISRDDAGEVLDVLWELLENPAENPTTTLLEKHGRLPSSKALRILALKVAVKFDTLPSTFYISHVNLGSRESCGTGGFADVFRGHLGGEDVALKRVRNANLKAVFFREALVWKRLEHPHVAEFRGVSSDAFHHSTNKASTCLVIRWYNNGNIRHHIDALIEQGKLSKSDPDYAIKVNDWLRQIASGLAYLHSEGIVHGDLHGANILVDDNAHVRLTDFGRSVDVAEKPGQYVSYDGDSYLYRSPELHEPHPSGSRFRFSRKYPQKTTASDIYAFACTAVELYENSMPKFQNEHGGAHTSYQHSSYQHSKFVLSGGRPGKPENMTDSMWNLTQRCWSQKPTRRPTAKAVADSIDNIKSGGEYSSHRFYNLSTVVLRLVGSRRLLPPSSHGKFASDIYEARNSVANL